jgi:hypothetical protein
MNHPAPEQIKNQARDNMCHMFCERCNLINGELVSMPVALCGTRVNSDNMQPVPIGTLELECLVCIDMQDGPWSCGHPVWELE